MNPNRLASEWERQDAIIIVWPHSHSDWAHTLNQIEVTYLNLCKYIGRQQDIILVAYDNAHVLHIQQKLGAASVDCQNITFATIPTNDIWVRDYGPVCVGSGTGQTLLDFEFDGWGQKYECSLDNAFNTKLFGHLKPMASYRSASQVLEAGNIEINSHGELLCSRTCFRRNSRTLHTDLVRLEEQLGKWLECSKIHWLDTIQLAGDDTHGHVDTLARFCTNDIIVYSASCNRHDANHAQSARLAMQLAIIRKQSCNRFELVPLPLPDPMFRSGQQLPATYTNFLITNHTVLVPVFNDKRDNHALRTLDELFPDREIIDIESNALIQQSGGIHCATKQIPEGFIA